MSIPLSWSFDPSVCVGTAAMAVGYAVLARGRLDRPRRAVSFAAGLAIIWLALESPLDEFGDGYLLSAHLFEHLLMGMAATALMVAGLSPAMARWLWRSVPGLSRYGEPMPAMVICMVVMLAWQTPALIDRSLASETVHILAHLSMIAGGALFWWPWMSVTSSCCLNRLNPLGRARYLLAMSIPSLAGAIVLWTLPFAACPPYAADPRVFSWLTPLLDQRLAGGVLALTAIALAALGGTTAARSRRPGEILAARRSAA